ncbi:hypothetical protein KSP39_PZI006821 [Platanthera zijinensis]|uniref:Uncharacterized protein n=1 Tax=Platanthera zijinensis TaxID=2320716 RepID=A0AAP0G9Z3_9ASPA
MKRSFFFVWSNSCHSRNPCSRSPCFRSPCFSTTLRVALLPQFEDGSQFEDGRFVQQASKKGKSIVPGIDYTKLPKIPALGSAAFHQWFSPFFDDIEISDDGSEGEEDAQPSKKGKSSKGGRKR